MNDTVVTSSGPQDATTRLCRLASWTMIGALAVFMINNYLSLAHGWPGAGSAFTGDKASGLSWLQLSFFGLGFAASLFYIMRTPGNLLRTDSRVISNLSAFIVRAAFWAVLYIGLVDAVISFLRVEGLLAAIVGDDLTIQLGRALFRGPNVHLPLLLAGFVTALFTRSIGFTWLALLIVIAELTIVLTRFIFSYEQAFMGDLVRFWYAALFLFASAYTLLEEGHVRVDVLYAGFTSKTKGFVNAVGSVLLGLSVCWTIIVIGMSGKSSIINGPMINFEISQSGFGLYIKYLMAGFLGIFAITMAIQFVSYFLEAVADVRDEPGKQDHAASLNA